MADEFLNKVYGIDGAEAVRDLYDDWAASYDDELARNRYATPARCAGALASAGLPVDAAILDMGCGTGLSGAAFAAAGFTTLDGCDLSPGMLDQARARGLYRGLYLPDALPAARWDAVAAVGVISPGAGPPELFDTCLGHLAPGGRFVFSLNDHAFDEPDYTGRLARALASGSVRTLFEERGDHLPEIGLRSVVYVLEKT